MPRFTHKPRYACSFCDKSQEDVAHLIAGSGVVYICDECVLRFQQETAPTDLSHTESHRDAHNAKPKRCSFCGKSKAELGDIVLHQSALRKGDVRICNECVELCIEMLDDIAEIDASVTAGHPPDIHSQPAQHCSLCYKNLPEVRGLLEVAHGISICNECVSLAHLLFEGQAAPPDSADVISTFRRFDWVRNPYMKHTVGISEIVLWVADKEASLRFYRDLLELEVISPPELRNTFLRVGEGNAGIPQMIVLVPKTVEVLGKPSGYQLHHLALELPPDRFDLQHEALVQAGYQPRTGKHPVLPSRTMYVDDPDGNEVEFICRF